jgi:hypothetical protein
VTGLNDVLEGPTALTFVKGDTAQAAKAITSFNKVHDVLTYKGGLMGETLLDEAQFTAIAKLPSRDTLNAQLAGVVASPIVTLTRGLGSMISGLAIALQQVAEKGLVGGGNAPAEAPAEEASTGDVPAKEAPAETEAEAEAPAEEAEIEAEAAPAEAVEAEAEAADADTEPAAEESPAEEASADEASAEAANADTEPAAEESPAEPEADAEEAPAEPAAEESPADEAEAGGEKADDEAGDSTE